MKGSLNALKSYTIGSMFFNNTKTGGNSPNSFSEVFFYVKSPPFTTQIIAANWLTIPFKKKSLTKFKEPQKEE